MVQSTGFVRTMGDVVGLLSRAASRVDAGELTSARHLLARAGRSVAGVLDTLDTLDTPLTAIGPSGGARAVLDGALQRIRSSHAALVHGSVADARGPLRTASFAIDLQLPYGALRI